jgi:hypothetical protein
MTNNESDSNHCYRRRSRRHGHRGRKERVLHTRVSEQLSDDIRKFAEDLRVPASNLVRNVLEEVFAVADSVSDDVGDLLDDLLGEAEGVRERVRDQTESAHRRRSRSRGEARGRSNRRSRRRAGSEDDVEVEAELRSDEAGEAHQTPDAEATTESPAQPDPPVQSKPRAAELFPDILGWQPLVLNRDFACGRCERNLAAGESAFLGIGEQGLTKTALCGRCAGSR